MDVRVDLDGIQFQHAKVRQRTFSHVLHRQWALFSVVMQKSLVLLNFHVVSGISGIKTVFIHAVVAKIMRTPHKCNRNLFWGH